jgi:hypothetical protein
MSLNVVPDPIDLETFENVVHEWFSNASDLNTIWRNQNAPQPEYPFGSLAIISGPTPDAPDWELRQDYSSGRPAGQELRFHTCVPCSIVVSCQAYVGNSDVRDPGYKANVYIERAKAALSLLDYATNFDANNISVYRYTPTIYPNVLIGGEWVNRAQFDVTFGTTLNSESYLGYIETVELKSTSLGVDEVITLP